MRVFVVCMIDSPPAGVFSTRENAEMFCTIHGHGFDDIFEFIVDEFDGLEGEHAANDALNDY